MKEFRYLAGPLVVLAAMLGAQQSLAANLLPADLNDWEQSRKTTVSPDGLSAVVKGSLEGATISDLTQGLYKLSFNYVSSAGLSLQVWLTDSFGGFETPAALSKTLSAIANSSASYIMNLNAGTYTVRFASQDATVSNVQLTAVPGPIAAAGLPGVLGLIGFAAWKRRRSIGAA